MTEDSHSSTGSTDPATDPDREQGLRRQPKQRRGQRRIERILTAAAEVFDEVGYEAATTHQIAARAGTAIGSLYQFFADKQAIFHAMEIRHIERVKRFWTMFDIPTMVRLPLPEMIHVLVSQAIELFEQPVSRVVFVQFYLSRHLFQSIDDSMTQEAIAFVSGILRERKASLHPAQSHLLAEVCVHAGNAVILAGLRHPDPHHRRHLAQAAEELMVSYLRPHLGEDPSPHVMKVMICPRCGSEQISKNGTRRGKQCFLCKHCGRQFVDRSNPDL